MIGWAVLHPFDERHGEMLVCNGHSSHLPWYRCRPGWRCQYGSHLCICLHGAPWDNLEQRQVKDSLPLQDNGRDTEMNSKLYIDCSQAPIHNIPASPFNNVFRASPFLYIHPKTAHVTPSKTILPAPWTHITQGKTYKPFPASTW